MAVDWASLLERAQERVGDGERRLDASRDSDSRQRQLTRLGNAASAAGLCLLMVGRRDEARDWFARAAARWRESYDLAPPGSWGRPIGAIKACVLGGDWPGARAYAEWTLAEDAAASDSPIGRYAACLALLVLGRDDEARRISASLRGRRDFPADVADALAALGVGDEADYARAAAEVLTSFEAREDYLEDVPVADTVLVLQALAAERGMAVELESPLLPA